MGTFTVGDKVRVKGDADRAVATVKWLSDSGATVSIAYGDGEKFLLRPTDLESVAEGAAFDEKVTSLADALIVAGADWSREHSHPYAGAELREIQRAALRQVEQRLADLWKES